MKKINPEEKLSHRATRIALLCVAFFLVLGIVAAVVSHEAYLKNRKAEIVDFKPVYVYGQTTEEIDLSDVIVVSKGASWSVTKVLDKNLTALPVSTKFDVRNGQTYFVFIKVVNEGRTRLNDYVLELTNDATEKGLTPSESEIDPMEMKEIISE